MANEEHINREAHDKSKGFRLQKLRAVELMVESEKLPDDTVMFWAIEKKEDVYQSSDGVTTLEEDKAYDENSSFTFNSIEVKKALVSFVDLWIHYEYSDLLKFNFYSSNKIGTERSSAIIESEKITLPEGKMIELASNSELSNEFLDAAKKFILYEVKDKYGEKSTKYKTVSAWKDDWWKRFFKMITWKFEQPNEEELNTAVLEKIKNCKWFSASLHDGMEDFIKSKLIDELDRKQTKPDFFNRVIPKSDVQLIFEKAKKGSLLKKNDALWEMWNRIEEPVDKRNVVEKLTSIWTGIEAKKLVYFSTKAVEGGIERDSYSGEKDFMALRYRIYSFCESELNKLTSDEAFKTKYSPEECLDLIFAAAKGKINELSNTFEYNYNNDDLIYNVILELFDNCYLAFDNE